MWVKEHSHAIFYRINMRLIAISLDGATLVAYDFPNFHFIDTRTMKRICTLNAEDADETNFACMTDSHLLMSVD